MQTETALARFLWHPVPRETWKHQDEAYLFDLIRVHLDYDLVSRGFILNREVQILGGLDRFDIKVDATVQGDRNDVRQLTVIVEVKGSWNADLFTSMEAQLVEHYLTHNGTNAGIYVGGWYQCAQRRGTHYRSETLEITRDKLKRKAQELSNDDRTVRAIVIDARLPASVTRESEPGDAVDGDV